MILELNHIAIYVEDIEISLRFYTDIIGLKVISRPAFDFPGAWLQIGNYQQLHLIGIREEDRDREINKEHAKPRGNHFALGIDDYLSVETMLKMKGAEYLSPRKRPDGAMQIFLKDPDGYWIELVQIFDNEQ